VSTSPNADVAIVGAGFIGLSCAYFLAGRGVKVVVLERKLVGAGSSTRNGGGFRSQLGTATNIKLSLLSEPYWTEFEERFGVDPWLRKIGYLFLAADEAELQTLRDQVELQNELGVPSELLAAEDLSKRWPILTELGFAGGSYCGADGFLNQHRALLGVAVAAESAGATIECGSEVVGFEVEADAIRAVRTTNGIVHSGVVVNCAGAWAPHVAEAVGVELPIRSRRVQLLHARPIVSLPPDLPWLIGPGGQVHIRQETAGRVQVGGFLGVDETVDASAYDHDADDGWITEVLERAHRTFAVQIERTSVLESWAGLYPCTPDQHPIIDRTATGMVVVGGFAGLGLMHAPAAGLLAAELIIDGEVSSINAADVSLARFLGPIDEIERTGF
jgi:glycine/D-amino acid oxidase-like deaminating enzyme